jgi:predicted transglutaminase-like cysteine proteinase
MPTISDCSACSSGAWLSATNVVSLLTPREPGLMETIRNAHATENQYAAPQLTTIDGMFAIINAFRFERTEADLRPDEELIQDELFTRTYLQYPNTTLAEFVFTIVNRSDSNDEKASKIIRWVVDNIDYQTDEAAWGRKEMWQPPAVTFQRRAGDCEDGAFLVHSLLLNAGVPWERIRTYGGLVRAGRGAETGGHAWTAYRRESDDQWVVLDTSYFPNILDVGERTPMKRLDDYYLDTLFYMTARYSIQTEGNHRIINPGIYTASGTWAERVFFPTGVMIRGYA